MKKTHVDLPRAGFQRMGTSDLPLDQPSPRHRPIWQWCRRLHASALLLLAAFRSGIGRVASRMRDPGMLYNLGNALGFIIGLGVALATDVSHDDEASVLGRGIAYVAGSPAAAALTAATGVFFWGGIVYTKAWLNDVAIAGRM